MPYSVSVMEKGVDKIFNNFTSQEQAIKFRMKKLKEQKDLLLRNRNTIKYVGPVIHIKKDRKTGIFKEVK